METTVPTTARNVTTYPVLVRRGLQAAPNSLLYGNIRLSITGSAMCSHRKGLLPVLAVSFCMLFLLACGPSPAFVRASQAEQSGDWITAVQGYRQALAEDPEDEEIAARVQYAEEQLVLTTVVAVEEALSGHDYGRALATVGPSLALMPQESRLVQSERRIRTDGITFLGERLTFGEFRMAFEQTGLLATYYPHDPDVANLHTEARLGFFHHLTERAATSEDAGRLGDALVAWGAASSLTSEADLSERVAVLRQTLLDEIDFRFHVDYRGPLAGAAPPIVAGAAAKALDEPSEAMLAITAELGEAEVDETYRAYIVYQPYLAGHREVPNPSYNSAFHRSARAEERLIDAEEDVIDDERDYFRAEEERAEHLEASDYSSYHSRWESAFNSLQDSRREVQRRREDLLDARQDLSRISPTITEEVWEDFPYEVREFTRRSSAELWCRLERPSQPEHHLHETYSASTSDLTHDGYPHVGVASNPFRYPLSDADLASTVRARALQRVAELVAEDFTNYRSGYLSAGLAAKTSDPAMAVEHLVRYILLNPGNVSPDAAAYLDANADLWDLSLIE